MVNTFTARQNLPWPAMDADGDFVVTWTGYWDGAGASAGIFGQRFSSAGAKLGGSAVVPGCTRCSAADVAAYIDSITPLLNVDGDTLTPLTDGLLILRRLFGFSGQPLINNALGNSCNPCDASSIAAYIDTLTM
jgi:hypothetical protein